MNVALFVCSIDFENKCTVKRLFRVTLVLDIAYQSHKHRHRFSALFVLGGIKKEH